jgi:transcriptional regulator
MTATERQRKRHNSALALPGLTDQETTVLQLRASGYSYRAIQMRVGLAPRKLWDVETAALSKLIKYVETQQFLMGENV